MQSIGGLSILLYIVFLVIGGGVGYFVYKSSNLKKIKEVENKIQNADKDAQEIIKKADQKFRESEQKARELELNAQKEIEKRNQKVDFLETRLVQKEEKIDQKLELLEKQKETMINKQQEIEVLISQQKEVLSKVSQLTPEEAKAQLFEAIENENKQDIVKFIEKFKGIKNEEAEKESASILARILPRVATTVVSEFTVSIVDIPSEDTKGRLIGREGRNVSYFEKVTGVEVLIDDTPGVVKLSSYDADKRFIAVETMKVLVKDGRINPVYIEKTYNEIVANYDNLLIEKGKEALAMLNIPMQKPDIVKMIGQYIMRYSYGQNLRTHSIEVAKIAEAIANEIGLDGMLAKKAGLLHDIGKIVAGNGQSHAKVGADVLRKYGYDDVIVNAAEGHHHDVNLIHPISWIVAAADAISASRPGARFNTKDFFVEKMSELEKLITSVDGVDKVHIMQAGREIMVFVNPGKIDDLGVEKLLKDVGKKVEDQLDYPGMIRVVGIREFKVIDYLR